MATYRKSLGMQAQAFYAISLTYQDSRQNPNKRAVN